MGKINQLKGHITELIAAGEVVERPSSVVKELLENAIDAGATAITVEIQNGGTSFIRVSDNGSGIAPEDIPIAFLRHATSKIAREEDLNNIGTLGFRGEALAAICAVAKVELMSKTSEQKMGRRYIICGGEQRSNTECGCPTGTTIVVRDLFYNTPARMKFLKKNVTEGNAVESALVRVAISHPGISFRFIRDGQNKVQTPGTGKVLDAVYQIYGRDCAAGLIPCNITQGPYQVQGFVSRPECARGNRSMQHFYVNGRYVKTKTAMAALEQGYKNMIMSGKFPYCFLFITMPYQMVDVNVHPAKIEVRFANENNLFNAVYSAVKSAVMEHAHSVGSVADKTPTVPYFSPNALFKEQPTVHQNKAAAMHSPQGYQIFRTNPQKPLPGSYPLPGAGQLAKREADKDFQDISFLGVKAPGASSVAPTAKTDLPKNSEPRQEVQLLQQTFAQSYPKAVTPAPQLTQDQPKQEQTLFDNTTPIPTVVGELFSTYIVCQLGNTAYLVDKHAAHERILYEQLKRNYTGINRQILLVPVSVDLLPEEMQVLEENKDLLQKSGFVLERFGNHSMVVREIPSFFATGCDVVSVVQQICTNLQKGSREIEASQLDWLFNNTACRAAIKAGNYSTTQSLQQLIQDIYRYNIARYCPHGRPIMIQITKNELEKRFGRE